MIERAYRLGEALELQVWTEDEFGPYQAIPQPGAHWRPEGDPLRLPHEYVRGGTGRLLALFRPATGEVRAIGAYSTANAVLHPWLMAELEAIVDRGPATAESLLSAQEVRDIWAYWQEGIESPLPLPPYPLPPLRCLLILDNLSGHKSRCFREWCTAHGVLPLYTPLGGSWLNMAESVGRILVRRALKGQHPRSAEQLIEWLEATVRGWNRAPTPFQWGGKRASRRRRARERRHTLGGSGAYTRRPVARTARVRRNGYNHVN